MGEHKLREAGNGDEKPPMKPHLVEAEDLGEGGLEGWGPAIEAMYDRLEARAKADDSIIMNKVQNINTYCSDGRVGLVVVLTAQRMSREDLERAQRQSIIQGGPRR